MVISKFNRKPPVQFASPRTRPAFTRVHADVLHRGSSTDLDFPTSPSGDGSWLSPECLQRNALPSGSAPAGAPPRHSRTTTTSFPALASKDKSWFRSRATNRARTHEERRSLKSETMAGAGFPRRGRDYDRQKLRCIRHEGIHADVHSFSFVLSQCGTTNRSQRGLGGDWARGPEASRRSLGVTPTSTPVFPRYHADR